MSECLLGNFGLCLSFCHDLLDITLLIETHMWLLLGI